MEHAVTPDSIRRAIVEHLLTPSSRRRAQLDHTDGLLRGLLWALTGDDPGPNVVEDLPRVFRLAGIPFREEGSEVVFATPDDED